MLCQSHCQSNHWGMLWSLRSRWTGWGKRGWVHLRGQMRGELTIQKVICTWWQSWAPGYPSECNRTCIFSSFRGESISLNICDLPQIGHPSHPCSRRVRGKIGVCVVDVLQKLVEMSNICWIKILSTFWIQIPRLGCADLRMVLLKPVDPVWAWDNATDVKHEGLDVVSVKQICNGSLVVDPI